MRECARWLLGRNVSVDVVDDMPLLSAFSDGIFHHYHNESTYENVEYGADTSAMTEAGRSALDDSTGSGYPDSKEAVLHVSWR